MKQQISKNGQLEQEILTAKVELKVRFIRMPADPHFGLFVLHLNKIQTRPPEKINPVRLTFLPWQN